MPKLSNKAIFLAIQRVLFSLLCLCFHYSINQAQNTLNFRVKNEGLLKVTSYLPKEYKGHAQNWSFAQDNRGVIYAGNMTGVLQFDGSQWRKLPIANYQIAKDKSGRLYTAFGYLKTNPLGKMKYQSLKNLLPKKQQKLAFPSTRGIIVTPNFVAFHKIGSLLLYNKGKAEAMPLSNDFIKPLLSDNQRLFMVKKGVGLMRLSDKRPQKWSLVPGGEMFADKQVMSMIPFDKQQWLLSTHQHGLFIMDAAGFRPWDVPVNSFLKHNQVNCSLALNNTQFAFGTLRNGVLITNKKGEAIQLINQRNGLSSHYIRSLFLDKDHALWLGLNNGIARVETATPFSLWNKDVGLKGALNHIARLHKGKFYIGTSQGVFYRKHTNYINPLSPQSQFKLIEATKGSVFYLQTTPDGLLCAHRKGIFLIKDTTATQLVATRGTAFTIINLQKTNQSYALASTSKDLVLLENKEGKWVHKHVVKGYTGYIRYLYQDLDGYIWVTTKAGIYRFTLSPQLDKITAKKLYTKADGLPQPKDNNVFGLSDGQFVCGTTKGVYLYDKAKDRFIPHSVFNIQLGIKSYVQWIKEDKNKNIWFWTEAGIVFAKKNARGSYTLERKLFDKYRELFSNYMAPHVMPIDDQNILFETRNGVVHYNSKIDKNHQKPFSVLIREVRTTKGQDSLIFGGNFSESEADKIVSKQPDKQIHTLPYEANNIHFTFSAIYFEDAHKTQYRYMLKGFDKEWSEWTNENKKEYTNLPSRHYSFSVQARNVYGTVSTKSIYKFIITPPWYQTVWAYGLLTLSGILLLWAIIHLYTRRLKQQKIKLENLVSERTQEIQHKNVVLQSQKQEIETQAIALKEINEETVQQRDKIDQAYQNVQLLSEIGKDITATFSLTDITRIVYERIQHLMNVEEFGIGYYLPKRDAIDFKNYFYKGKALPPMTVSMANKNRLAVHCIDHKKEIIIGDLANEYQQYVEKLEGYREEELLNSIICLPLIAGGEIIGIASVQSSHKYAYSKHQINIFRNLAIYIAIALKNSSSYTQIDLQNIKITDSIRYAQNIQATILPSEKALQQCFDDHAIIYWPKDIVSGDFYWLQQATDPHTQELYTFVAVIDCTGHGVPGAFMSLIGYQLLNDIVNQRKILEPYLILEELDKLIIEGLKQKESENKDGMDVCLCRLKPLVDGHTELLYSGAKRSLIYVENGEFKSIKGDRIFIGGYMANKHNKFTNNKATLAKGSLLYLSSDGIADMPNDRRRSFGSQRLHKTLITYSALPLEEQKNKLIQAVREFQGNQEQRDDITLLAIKI